MWRECVLRSAGFPAAGLLPLTDSSIVELATASLSDDAQRTALERAWPEAASRSLAALRAFAAEPRFREAVAWQNPSVVRTCLDVPKLRPRHEMLIANYVQRYSVKNDTIGFFGPIAWGRWTDDAYTARATPGPDLLARRGVYFENWAIEALAQTLTADAGVEPWLRPRRNAACLLDGRNVRKPYGPPVTLTPAAAALLRACDGSRTVRQIAAETSTSVEVLLTRLHEWRDSGLIHMDLGAPIEARPEVTLRRTLSRIGDVVVRERALEALQQLESAREAVEAAAGNADALMTAIAALNDVFERVTGQAPTRSHGKTYAGRTLVYEDTVRGVTFELGQRLLAALTPPLTPILDSARWLVGRVAERYETVLGELFDKACARTGADAVPFAMLLASATPYLGSGSQAPPLVSEVTTELQSRWARILRIPPDVRHHSVTAASIAAGVRKEFPDLPTRWTLAATYSPDLMIAADGPDALARDEFTLVLGELHVARNTLDSRPFAELHEDPSRLLAAVEADQGGRRICATPPKDWEHIGPRTYPTPLRSPLFTYWCQHADTSGAPGPVLPIAGMSVRRQDRRLIVRSAANDADYDLMEVIGEQLSYAVVNGFKPIAEAGHQPRVSIDRLVVQRESWTFDANDVPWALTASPVERFRQAQAWRLSHGMPQRMFCSRPSRAKPTFVDFSSIALVDLLARTIERATADTGSSSFTLTEMMPDLDRMWLTDAAGARYTSELRCVILDRRHASDGDDR